MEEVPATQGVKSAPKFVRFGGRLCDVIEDYGKGLTDGYSLISEQLKDDSMKSSQLFELLKDIITVSHLLGKSHKPLVFDILRVKWFVREKEICEIYHMLVLELVTSNPVHLVLVLNRLISNFNSCLHQIEDACLPQEDIFQSIHKTLRSIFTLIPVSTNMIGPLLVANFPFIKNEVHILECYVKNLLYITTYEGSLRIQVLELIILKGTNVDTLLTREKIEQDAQGDEDVFEMEEEKKDDFVEKLDLMMETILQYIKETCYCDGDLTKQADALMKELVTVFDKIILPIHGCSHIQFVMFYMCSFKESFLQNFLKHLWSKVQNPNVPVLLRQTAASYIASLLARAKYIPSNTVLSVISALTSWAQNYIRERQEEGCMDYGQEAAKHGTFYAVCQAIFYVLIFRQKSILDTDSGYLFLQNLNLSHIVLSRLNPLKFCIGSVVDLFSSVMRINQIVYCDTIIERNNRQCIPVCGKLESSNIGNPLDSFFPFDPYLLRNTKHLFHNLYQEWEGRVPQQGEKTAEPDSDDEASVEIETAIAVPELNNNEEDDKLKMMSEGAAISPGFSLITSLAY